MISIFWFVFSFLILVSVWLNYSYIVSRITVESPRSLMLNLVLLLCVSLEPFLLNIMVDDQNIDEVLGTSSSLYAVIMGIIMACLGQMQQESLKQRRKEGGLEGAEKDRELRNSRALYSAIFFITVLPVFWEIQVAGLPLRFWVWWASPAIWVAKVALNRTRRKR
jgi:uncharacterized membrane protein